MRRTRSLIPQRALALAVLAGLTSCGRATDPSPDKPPAPSANVEVVRPQVPLLQNEIPAAELEAVMRAHYQGLGHMERYAYRDATAAFSEVHERAPGWIPGSINLAIAELNDSGAETEQAKKPGKPVNPGNLANFDRALGLLRDVITRDPENLTAHYCRGLIVEALGRVEEANRDFRFVADRDPTDAHALYRVAATYTDPERPGEPPGVKQADALIDLFSKALDRNPYLVTALYRLGQSYGWARNRGKQDELLRRWRLLNIAEDNPAGAGDMDMTKPFYGGLGRHALVIDPFAPEKAPTVAAPPPRFDLLAPLNVKLPDGERWVNAYDFAGPLAVLGRARSRFGATVVPFDADGDGRTDLFLGAAVKTPTGLRDALLLNRGDSGFEDVSRAWGLPDDAPSVAAAAGDFDADRQIDLYVTGLAGNRLLRNDGGSRFADVTEAAGMGGPQPFAVAARWLDIDQDGDLDLFVLNYTDRDHAGQALSAETVPGAVNSAFRNVGLPPAIPNRPVSNYAPVAVAMPDVPAKKGLTMKFQRWPKGEVLEGPPARYTGLAALDLDNDRDLDLVLTADGQPARAVFNDRAGDFHGGELAGLAPPENGSGLLVADFDKDGRADLAAPQVGGRLSAWRNVTNPSERPRRVAWEVWPADATTWRCAAEADLDLDSWSDLVGLPEKADGPVVAWGRNEGNRLATQAVAVGPPPAGLARWAGLGLADVAGDAQTDLILVADGAGPFLARNLGNGRHWLALDLGGRWRTSFDHMRTNPQALGTRVTLEGQGLLVTRDLTTPASGTGQGVGPVVLGLGQSPSAELLRLRWPDGTMQCELNVKADVRLNLVENNRKVGSCPVLFTWNGTSYECLGDFLGAGALGFLAAPGVRSQPDRDESFAINGDQLRPIDGVYRLVVTEPMDEVAYLDRLELVIVDRPVGVSVTPDERFTHHPPRPSGDLIAWTTRVDPLGATDLNGRDIAARLRAFDRDTVGGFRRQTAWPGYAEDHGVVLDFGDRLSRYAADAPLTLVLAGWAEYPYSQTNYAAATAGVTSRSLVVERRQADGRWAVIEPDAGYPAGTPRRMTLDMTGKLTGPACVLRIHSNIEYDLDEAFVALRDPVAGAAVRRKALNPGVATLGHRGYNREYLPGGRPPALYDYDAVDPAPLALLTGRLTRYGDVAPLLRHDDDRLCTVGPGDEVRLEFDASGVEGPPAGWSRSYLLKAVGYCKDADPYTATGDSVGPLPWREMPAYPPPADAHGPDTEEYRRYLREYQTRPAGLD